MPAALALLSVLAAAPPNGPVGLPDAVARLRRMLQRPVAPPAEPDPEPAADAPQPAPPPTPSPAPAQPGPKRPDRTWTDRLWGKGFLLPGGTAEARRLTGLLPLSDSTALLLVGRDGGGFAAIAGARGPRISAHLDEPELTLEMEKALARFGKRLTRAPWNPENPAFRPRYHDHALALEALRKCRPDRLIPAIVASLRPGGQIVMLDMVRAAPGRTGRDLDRWLELEGRPEPPPALEEMDAALEANRFTVHVMEDAGLRHGPAVMEAWSGLVSGMAAGPDRPSHAAARSLVTEAEMWLLRQRLMQAGTLRLIRWHASLR